MKVSELLPGDIITGYGERRFILSVNTPPGLVTYCDLGNNNEKETFLFNTSEISGWTVIRDGEVIYDKKKSGPSYENL